jgi:hypothetical protein
VRVLSVWPTLAAERSITSSVGKQLRATTIGGLLLLSGSKSHAIQFIASRKQSCARPACPEDCAVLCYARYDIMHAAYVLLVYEAEAQLCCCRRCCRASVVPLFV